VNAVSPAVVQTRILDQVTPEQIKYMTDKIPMKRTGTPEEIAAVVHFCAVPNARSSRPNATTPAADAPLY